MIQIKCCICSMDIFVKRSRIKNSGNYCAPCWWKVWQRPSQKKLGKDRQCLVCNKTFYVPLRRLSRGGGKFWIANQKPYKCKMCGKEFLSPGGRGKAKFCSRECCGKSRRNGVIKKCDVCDKGIYIPLFKLEEERLYFCTKQHFDNWQGRNKKLHICAMCGREFAESPSISRKYCSSKCRYNDPQQKERLISYNVKMQKGTATKLEIAGYALLDGIGVKYQPQYLLHGKFCVDAFLPDKNVVIQFDGDYWHGNPSKYSTLDKRQSKRAKLDVSQDKYLTKCGYKIIRVWESDMKCKREEVKLLFEGVFRSTEDDV